MSDTTGTDTSNEGGNTTGENTPDAGDTFKPITSQADLDKILGDRVARERNKYADYRDVKAKAAEYDKVVEANKTEAQKLADATAAAEQERDQARAEAMRLRVAAKFGISDEDADLFLNGADEDTLTKQAERLAQRSEDRKKQGNHVPREGSNPSSGVSEEREVAQALFNPGG